MAGNVEGPPLNNAEQAIIDRLKQEVRDARTANNGDLIRRIFQNENRDRAGDMRDEVKKRVAAGKEGDVNTVKAPLEGRVGETASMRHKAKVVQTYVAETIKAFNGRMNLTGLTPGTPHYRLIEQLTEKFRNPDNEIEALSSGYIFKVLQRALSNHDEPEGVAGFLSKAELRELGAWEPEVQEKLVNALLDASDKTDEEKEVFRQQVKPEERERRDSRDEIEHLGRDFFEDTDWEVIHALKTPEEFANLVANRRERIVAENEARVRRGESSWDTEEIDRRTGEAIERDIVLRFSKIYAKVDNEKAGEFWDNIVTSGFTNSIETLSQQLERRLDHLTRILEQQGDNAPEILRNIHFYQRKLKTEAVERKIGGKIYIEQKVTPVPGYERVRSISDFLQNINTQVGHEIDARKYFHNIRAIFRRGGGEKGYWPQIAGYAEQYGANDLDHLMLLPDSELFMTANRLYTKYVEEEFAKHDWKHKSDMFTEETQDNRNRIENKVLDDLEMMYGEEVGVDKWRIRRAMNMAVGLAKGLFMGEVEAAAWADPVLNPDGKPNFQSYYTNDNNALAPLNPAHHFWRWQSEQSMQKSWILFLPIQGMKTNFWDQWEHTHLYHRALEYQKSYIEGDHAFHHDKKRPRLFIDLFPNMFHIGGIFSRSGWRHPPAYGGWVRYKSTPGKIEGTQAEDQDRVEILKTFKNLENIGYEVSYHFLNDKVAGNKPFLIGDTPDRNELFHYLYGKYINKSVFGDETATRAALQQEVGYQEARIRAEIEEEHRNGFINSKERDRRLERTELERRVYRHITYKALAGMVSDRMPTKFVRVERDKHTQHGTRAWEVVRTTLGWDPEKFDKHMRQIMIVEAEVRRLASQKMRQHLRDKADASTFDFNDLEINDYVVNEDTIRITFADKPQLLADQDDVLRLYNEIRNQYSYGPNGKCLDEFAKKIDSDVKWDMFPFAIAPDEVDTEMLSYRGAGESLIARAMRDMGHSENNQFGALKDFVGALHAVSIDPKHDISKLVGALAKVKNEAEGMHSKDFAHKLVHHMSALAITYFKKDTLGRNPFTSPLGSAFKHSLAAEVVGTGRDVWQWDVKDIDKFIVELERQDLLRKEPYDLMKGPAKPDVFFPGTNIKIGEGLARTPDYYWHSKRLRDEFGASSAHITSELMTTYIPIVMMMLIWKFTSEALNEAEGKKSGGH